MSSTHTSLHYHIVFSTKNRLPFISPQWQIELYQYLAGTIQSVQGVPVKIGGMPDHIHLLVGLKPTHCLADFVRVVKQASSQWIHQAMRCKEFAWQSGYGAFSVSVSSLPEVTRYIENQADHHQKRTFQEEYLAILQKSGVAYDEKYLW